MNTYRQIVTLDYETFFSKDYSLKNKNLNTSEYIRHEDFKAQCVAIKIDNRPVVWYRDRDIDAAIRSIDWSNSALLAHNCCFDGFILSHHFGITPAYYLDTLSMARALHSNAIKAGLDDVAKFYKLGNKLPNVLAKSKGIRDLPDDLMTQLGQYCALDVELCRMIFDKMVQGYPQQELDLIDMTIRMFCDPILEIDIPRVERELERELAEKDRLIEESGVSKEELSSAPKFAVILKELGVDAPMKISPTTGELAYAFSKTDLDFTELLGHENPRVRQVVAARLAAKSTIGETRAKRFLDVGGNGKKLPILLIYFGAHTGRWSGGNKMNLQNLKRGGELRRSILAPEGHVIVVADSAQIEARVLAWLANDTELLDLFANGADVYKHMASQIYGVSSDKVTKDQRFIGKIATLGLGYGMGAAKFRHTLATGAMGPVVDMSVWECQSIVRAYRTLRLPITKLWQQMDSVLYNLYRRREGTYNPLRYDDQYRIWLPNGLYLQYPFLTGDYDHMNDRMTDYRYYDYETGIKQTFTKEEDRKKAKRIYGGLLTENIVQALARIIVGEQMHHISRRFVEHDDGKYRRVVSMTHDEIIVVVPEEEADSTLDLMLREMKTAPTWCKTLPLNAEGGYAQDYSK